MNLDGVGREVSGVKFFRQLQDDLLVLMNLCSSRVDSEYDERGASLNKRHPVVFGFQQDNQVHFDSSP
jgi:hypothetical protein